MQNIIIYCALNTTTGNDIDATSDLVERMFGCITSNPDSDGEDLPVVVNYDEVGVSPLWCGPMEVSVNTLHVFFGDWIRGILSWQQGDCEFEGGPIVANRCDWFGGYRTSVIIPGWEGCDDGSAGSTCCHE